MSEPPVFRIADGVRDSTLYAAGWLVTSVDVSGGEQWAEVTVTILILAW